jgi:hypothetical protein
MRFILDNRGRRVAVAGEPGADRWRGRPGLGAVVLAVFMAGIGISLVVPPNPNPRAAAGMLAAAGVVVLLGALRRRSGGWGSAARLADGRLRGGRCGACGRDLAGVGAEADGCTVCPGCGAAWRLARR